MSNCVSIRDQMASIMEVLTKTAVAEITKLVDDGSAALRLEMCRSQRENEALKRKLMQIEWEFGAARGYGEGAPDNSRNIALEVNFCNEFRDTLRQQVFDERLSTGPAINDQNVHVEKKIASSDALDMKCEPVDGEQDWPESLLLNEDRLEEDPGNSQSQAEQKNSGANTCGTLGAAGAGADCGAGPFCGEEELHMQPCPAGDTEKGLQAELKQESEGEPVTPALPPLGSADWGLELQCVWSEANGSETVQEKHGQLGGSLEHRGAQLDDDFSPLHYRASWRQLSEVDKSPTSHLKQQQNGGPLAADHSHGPPDDISAENLYPLGSPGEHGGRTPCEASLNSSAEAKGHQTIEGQGDFICTRCGKTFLDALQLKMHEEQHGLGKRFSCSECGKSFTSSRVLEKHQQIHNRKKPFACSWCDKNISNRHALQAHESIHMGLKPYVCSQCGKSFCYKGSLKTHQHIHTGEKPFSCLQCGKCFSRIFNLESHQRIHNSEKPFTCLQCGKCFKHMSTLKNHQTVHTGVKPYHCSECMMNFSRLGHLKTHQRVHTRGQPFSCTLCGISFSFRHVLEEHISTHSKGVVN